MSGCATRPENISGAYVSPLTYQNYDCEQIRSELARVSRKVAELTGSQRKAANRDAVAMGVGLVIFWPALFFLMGSDKKEELARLKGEYEALQEAAIQKKCFTPEEMEAVNQGRKG